MKVLELGEKELGSSLNTFLKLFLLFRGELGRQKLDVLLDIGDEPLLVVSGLLLKPEGVDNVNNLLNRIVNTLVLTTFFSRWVGTNVNLYTSLGSPLNIKPRNKKKKSEQRMKL